MTPEEVKAYNELIQRAYQVIFGTPDGKRVLADLVAYCHGRKTTFHDDARRHAFLEGRRDVLLRIQEFTNLTLEEIYQLRGFAQHRPIRRDTDD